MDLLFTNAGSMMDYMKSSLYEHMTFNGVAPGMPDMIISTLLKHYCEDDDYEFIRKTPEWENFKKKWEKG